ARGGGGLGRRSSGCASRVRIVGTPPVYGKGLVKPGVAGVKAPLVPVALSRPVSAPRGSAGTNAGRSPRSGRTGRRRRRRTGGPRGPDARRGPRAAGRRGVRRRPAP